MRRAGIHTAHLTPEQIEEARQLHARGWTFKRIGEHLGFRGESIRRALDPIYAAARREQINLACQIRGERSREPKTDRENATSISVKEDAAARLAEIPPDTRSLTARMAGDPLPGRSALDKRQQA